MPPSEASSTPAAKANSSGRQISFHTSNFCPMNYLKTTGPQELEKIWGLQVSKGTT